MIATILIAFFSIIGLVVLHELGHFLVAKKFGVEVEEFGVGYPPRLFGKKIGQTLYSINLLPFGAFVKIPGEGGEKSSLEDYQKFVNKPAWQRAAILLGGVVSFWLIAIVLLSVVFALGTPQIISDDETGPLINPKVQVLSVASNSPAGEAGIKTADVIIRIKGQMAETEKVDKVTEIQEFSEINKGQEIILTIQRGKEIFDVSLIPRVSPPEGEGAIGVALARTADKSFPWWQAPFKGVEATFNLTVAVALGWGKILTSLFQGQGLPQGVQLLGPVGIGSLIGQAAQVGINYFLQFIAMISVYLAIFNILPIPALDGGKLLFLVIEKIKGNPVKQKIEQNLTAVFFTLLLLLIVWATVRDVIRLF